MDNSSEKNRGQNSESKIRNETTGFHGMCFSSANRKMLESIIKDGMSLTYINSKGPNMLPCGTPERTGRRFEMQWLRVTWCKRQER